MAGIYSSTQRYVHVKFVRLLVDNKNHSTLAIPGSARRVPRWSLAAALVLFACTGSNGTRPRISPLRVVKNI